MVPRSRLDPKILTNTVAFNRPLGGRICEIDGGGAEIVKSVGPLICPPGATTLRLTGPLGAVTEIASTAVIRFAVVEILVTVTPGIGTIVAPARLNPLMKKVAELPW